MAGLLTTSFNLPNHIAEGIFKKAQDTSALARLSAAKPQKFGTEQVWTLTAAPKAELVGEGGTKSPTPTTYGSVTIKPAKVQVTMRFSEEVKWADEDYQIGVLSDMIDNAGIALSRALDLMAIHKINPLTGAVSSLLTDGLADVTQIATISGTKYDEAVEAAAGLVIAAGFTPSGFAVDPTLSFNIAQMRDGEGRKLYPELGFGQNVTNLLGMQTAVANTVSGNPEIANPSNIAGIVGQFDAFRWGVQRDIKVKMIESGDPDGLGDLNRKNEIALRAEIVYGMGILNKSAFALVKNATEDDEE